MHRKKTWMTLLAAPLACMLLAGCPEPPPTVPQVDIERYQGLWYEIASYPTFFNRGLVGTTAEYTINDDGTVRVENRAYRGSFDGEETSIVGTARAIDATNARLKVQFDSIPIVGGLFEGDYWIIDLDEADYRYAVVSDPRRATLFILGRTPSLEAEVLNGILDRLETLGFNLDELSFTPQEPTTITF